MKDPLYPTQYTMTCVEKLEKEVRRLDAENDTLRDANRRLAEALIKAQITEQEREVHKALGEVWNQFCALPIEHQQDASEFCYHIHILQRMVSARAGRRQIRIADKADFDEGFCYGCR